MPVLSFAFAVSATVVTLGFLTWFTLEIHGSHRGLAERGAALAEVLWPLVVAVGARHAPLGRRPSRLTRYWLCRVQLELGPGRVGHRGQAAVGGVLEGAPPPNRRAW